MLKEFAAKLRSSRGRSPRVLHISWGRMRAEGFLRGKDMKLWPGGGRKWDWSETGTRHDPGIQPADVQELVEQGSEVVVLSRGMQLVLQTAPETTAYLEDMGVKFHILETKEAVRLYNQLSSDGVAVGGLFHSTCLSVQRPTA